MKKGIVIKFDKKDKNHFFNEIDNSIDCNLLIISLLETLNDICKEHHLDFKEQIKKYLELGSYDDYIGDEKNE